MQIVVDSADKAKAVRTAYNNCHPWTNIVSSQIPRISIELALMITSEMAAATSQSRAPLPKTGCINSPGLNPSKFLLSATLLRDCEPHALALPMLAMDGPPDVGISLKCSCSRRHRRQGTFPSHHPGVSGRTRLGGSAVLALLLFGSLACGQLNWSMKPWLTRWEANAVITPESRRVSEVRCCTRDAVCSEALRWTSPLPSRTPAANQTGLVKSAPLRCCYSCCYRCCWLCANFLRHGHLLRSAC